MNFNLATFSADRKTVGQWALLFIGLLVAIYAATQNRNAPLLILLISLYVLAANFSMPVPPIRGGLIAVLGAASLLLIDGRSALLALGAGLILAELAVPLWAPLWQDIPDYPHRRVMRLLLSAGQLVTMTIVIGVITWWPISIPLPADIALDWVQLWPVWLAIGLIYAAIATLLELAIAFWGGISLGELFLSVFPRLFFFNFLLQPAALLIALITRRFDIPAFVVIAIVLTVGIYLVWTTWRSRYVLRRQMSQFSLLNRISEQMRETLDLREVLTRTYEQVNVQVAPDRFGIILTDGSERWQRPLFFDGSELHWRPDIPHEPDAFTAWVLERGRPLEVDSGTLHYAHEHAMAIPDPRPSVWLGLPLVRGARVMGAMVIHQVRPNVTIDRWSREILVAIARQASDAIDNARQYLATVRLYASTDEALSERGQQLQAILNATHEGFLMLDRNGRLMMANPVAEKILGLPNSAEATTRPQVAALLGYREEALTGLIEKLQRGESPAARTVVVPREHAGQTRFYEQVETAVMAAGDDLAGWLITLRDITERVEQETWREQFTNMVVHDLRNPLTTLLSSLESLDRSPDRPVKPVVNSGRRVTHHMLDMVDSLMDIARIEAGKMIVEAEAMRMPTVVNRVVQDVLPLAFVKEVELTFSFPDELPAVWADEVLVRRILVNLIDNALKFTPSGGRINGFLGVEPSPDGQSDPGVRCTIIDTGPGIPLAERDLIFDRFTKFDRGGRQVRGTGVGLTFCKLAVEAQGGEIWVDEAPGEGSCFIFTLPGVPTFEGFEN